METVSLLPSSNSPFYKSQTVASIFYSITFLIVSSVLLTNSIIIAVNERFTFSCKGLTDNYGKTLCLEAYNDGPNDLQNWLYLTTFIGPLIIIIGMIILMLRKKYTLRRNNCIVHIHQLYFLKVFLRFLFHLSVGLALFIKLCVFKTGQLILEGTYVCVIGNSTVTCIDGKAKSKSDENIACCSLHGLLFVFSLLELVYYGYKWKRSEEDRNRQSNGSIQCGECSYFIKAFNVFADCGSNSQTGTLAENSHLLPNSVENMPSTSIHASYGATVNIGDVACVSTHQYHEIKKKYRQQYKMHEIHCVDINNRIVLKEVDINKFAVKLKINCELPTMSTFRDEVRQHFAHLEGMRGDGIEISDLTDDENRVTFIRGIAGMGKSVLAKQLTYGWASGDIYQNFKLCIMFECRHLNYFKDHEGAELKKHEILGAFIKSKVSYDFGAGEGTLVIVDGLDELYDITDKDSIIFDLLDSKGKYGMAKVIITGRPHIEDKLDGYNNMGGLFKVEISGLSEDQIDKYIDRFSSREDHKVDINKAKHSSKGYLPIMNVPQFLNTLCCVAILMKGQAVSNNTELYCWTVYLLLKQHADKDGSSKKAPEVFREFSQSLSALSEVCHNLLTNNNIIFEGSIKSQLGDIGEDKEFVESLFIDVSDNITDKYQFKHLSLMEFLSALYICKKDMKNLLEIIKDNLEKGFIEVVSFVCRLLSGFSYGGIITEILKNVVGMKQAVDEKQLLGNVIELLNESGLDGWTKLSRSFELIAFFLNKDFNDKVFIMSIIRKCHGAGFWSDEVTTHSIFQICRHLESCGWKEDDIRMAFANIQFDQMNMSTSELLEVVTMHEHFCIGGFGIWLRGMKTTVNVIRDKFKGGCKKGYNGRVVIRECKLLDNEENKYCSSDRQLKELNIQECQLKTLSCFMNVCHWGMSCKIFWLWQLDIHIEWWERMVEMIEERHRNGDLKNEIFNIQRCTTRMDHELAVRILQCGMELWIEGEKWNNSNL